MSERNDFNLKKYNIKTSDNLTSLLTPRGYQGQHP